MKPALLLLLIAAVDGGVPSLEDTTRAERAALDVVTRRSPADLRVRAAPLADGWYVAVSPINLAESRDASWECWLDAHFIVTRCEPSPRIGAGASNLSSWATPSDAGTRDFVRRR